MPVARRRGDQYGLHGAAERDVPGTSRAPGTPLSSAGTPHLDIAGYPRNAGQSGIGQVL
jgi:hypothetical protein